MANTANPVLARILVDLGLFREKIGAMLMTATVVDDLVSWSLLAVIFKRLDLPGESSRFNTALGTVSMVGLLAVVLLVAGRYIATPLLRRVRVERSATGIIGLTVVMVLVSAAMAQWVGVHAFLGPFLLGLGMSPTQIEREKSYEVLHQFALSFFVPLYFVSMGLGANFVENFDPLTVTSIFLVACASKIVSVTAAARLTGIDTRTSLAIGMGMNARGATGIILASVGLRNHFIDQRMYVALVLTAIVTSLAAGPLMKWLLRLPTEPGSKRDELVPEV